MKAFYLTRKEMAQLLQCLQGKQDTEPLTILQDAWRKSHQEQVQGRTSLGPFISMQLPSIFEKVIRLEPRNVSLSLNEIVALGSQIEYSHFAITFVQNWVKRDFKVLIGPPDHGKKYSIEQAAILFIIEDLKASLDFDSIRKLLTIIYRCHQARRDAVINPVDLYAAYSNIFEELDRNNDQVLDLNVQNGQGKNNDHLMEYLIKRKADEFTSSLIDLDEEQKQVVGNIIVIAMLSVQSSYFQSLAKRFLNATLFLRRF